MKCVESEYDEMKFTTSQLFCLLSLSCNLWVLQAQEDPVLKWEPCLDCSVQYKFLQLLDFLLKCIVFPKDFYPSIVNPPTGKQL